MTTSRLAIILLVLSLSIPAAADFDFFVDPGSLSIRQTPKGTKITFRARKGSVTVTGAEAPTLDGASLHIFNSAGGSADLCARLPAANWRVSAIVPGFGPVGWDYSDPQRANGPVRRAHFDGVRGSRYGDIRAVLPRAAFTLADATQGSIGVIFRVASSRPPPDDHTRYCTDFASPYATISVDRPGAFRAAFSAQFPGPCPAAPAACSPGGAFLDAE